MKKYLSLLLTFCICFGLSACKGDTPVFVQSVAQLSGLGGIAPGDRFSAMVVSEHTTEIKKDGDKAVEEILVREGDDVTEGQALFSYNMDELQLSYDKICLERDQLVASIESYKAQIAQLERERNGAWGNNKLQYTVQIQSTQVDLKEAEITLKAKEGEVERAKALLENSTVSAPIAGRVQSINESGTDANGNPTAFITIQESGAYRVKGTLSELQRGGISEGQRIKMTSRVDDTKVWFGTVTLVDYENPVQNNNNYYMMSSDEMTTSSKYPFYVALDSTEGLMMGQHLYLELDSGAAGGIRLDASFVVVEDNGSAYVWAEKRSHLEKRTVTLGQYDEMANTYEILSGLTAEDYIAFPDSTVCHSGAPTTRVQESDGQENFGEEVWDMPMDFDGMQEPAFDMPEGLEEPVQLEPEEAFDEIMEDSDAKSPEQTEETTEQSEEA